MINKDVLKTALDAVHKYINSVVVVVDYTAPSVRHSSIRDHCMVHVVSLPDKPDKLFVLCHYGSSPQKAGTELGECLIDYLGFMPEMPDYVRGEAINNGKTVPVIGFFVDKESHESSTQVQVLPN